MSIIPIVFACNSDYAPYVGVAIKSLAQNSQPQNNYAIHILNKDICDNYKNIISAIVADYAHITIDFLNIDNYVDSETQRSFFIEFYHSPEAYFRIFIPKILPQFDKVIYLDSDVIVLDDIAKLYNTDISNHILAAAPDIFIINTITATDAWTTPFKHNLAQLNLKPNSRYFNSGVLVMNTKKMRAENFIDACITKLYEIKTPMLVDQDILNALYSDCYQQLNFEWNLLWFLPGVTKSDTINPVDEHDRLLNAAYEAARQRPKIIHYISGEKPWHKPEALYSTHFWHYARQTAFYEIIIYKFIISKNEALAKNLDQIIDQKTSILEQRMFDSYNNLFEIRLRCKLLKIKWLVYIYKKLKSI